MTGTELMEAYPFAKTAMREWFVQKMTTSIKNTPQVSDEFKQKMIDTGVSDDSLVLMIEHNPRALFDVLDENGIYVHVFPTPNDENQDDLRPHFYYEVLYYNEAHDGPFLNRREAEQIAVEDALILLDRKLSSYNLES